MKRKKRLRKLRELLRQIDCGEVSTMVGLMELVTLMIKSSKKR